MAARRAGADLLRQAAAPPPVLRPFGVALRAAWSQLRRHWTQAHGIYLAVLAVDVGLSLFRSTWYDLPLLCWLTGGGVALGVSAIAEADRLARERAHALCPTPLVGGYRLAVPPGELAPDLLLALDLLQYLYDHARRVERPVRGRRRATRSTYAVPLRTLCRRWAAERGLPIRRGDRTGHTLLESGVIRVVTISQARAWRLASPTVESAIKTLELATGQTLIRWDLGRRAPEMTDVTIRAP
ncbi:MAG: hypothetical protein ACP5VP_10990 [Candidatus Limnocylindrales bacterium]